MSLIMELKRRNVFRVGAAYVVASWLVIQVVETILPAFGVGDAAVRIVTILLAIGFIPTLVFAWVFELTPDGLKKETEVDRSRSITPQTGKKLDRMIMVVLVLALGYFAFDKFVLEAQREAVLQAERVAAVEQARKAGRSEALVESYGDKSIAVLAFDDMSPEGDQEYLSDGIAEEVLNLLAKIPELRVVSRSSAFSFKTKDLALTEIAQRLNVAHILEGSVRKAGNRVRITAQLIEARSDTHLWSETYDRRLDDIFAIQDDISTAVVNQLKIELMGDAPHAIKTNPEAYDEYLRGVYLAAQVHEQSLIKAQTAFENALQIDAKFGDAWVALGSVYRFRTSRGHIQREEGIGLARNALARALDLDPQNADAYVLQGELKKDFDWDWQGADLAFQTASRLAPNSAAALKGAASLAFTLGRFDEAIELGRKAALQDPLSLRILQNIALTHLWAGQLDKAESTLEQVLERDDTHPTAHAILSWVYLFQSENALALNEAKMETVEPLRHFSLALSYWSAGNETEAERYLNQLIEQFGDSWYYHIACAYAFMHQSDKAFRWLDLAYDRRDTGLVMIVGDPFLQNLHTDERWASLLTKLGLDTTLSSLHVANEIRKTVQYQ